MCPESLVHYGFGLLLVHCTELATGGVVHPLKLYGGYGLRSLGRFLAYRLLAVAGMHIRSGWYVPQDRDPLSEVGCDGLL